jgi:hypothetical protein
MSSSGFGLDVAPLRWFDLLAGDASANDEDFSMDLLNWREAAAQIQDPAVVGNTSVSAYVEYSNSMGNYLDDRGYSEPCDSRRFSRVSLDIPTITNGPNSIH